MGGWELLRSLLPTSSSLLLARVVRGVLRARAATLARSKDPRSKQSGRRAGGETLVAEDDDDDVQGKSVDLIFDF